MEKGGEEKANWNQICILEVGELYFIPLLINRPLYLLSVCAGITSKTLQIEIYQFQSELTLNVTTWS